MTSTLWSPKTFERADLKPGVGAAMGREAPGSFLVVCGTCLCILGLHGLGGRLSRSG